MIGEGTALAVNNEFASVEICLGKRGNGQLIWLTDRRSGKSRCVDPLALEGLVWAPDWIIDSLADPGCRDDGRA